MKLNLDVKNRKVDVEANVENLVEKSIDNHEKDWKEKFATKHNAKKELLKLKHEQQIELNDSNNVKKNWIQKIHEEKRKTKEMELLYQQKLKELELEEKKMQEEKENKNLIFRIVLSSIFTLIGIWFFVAGTTIDPFLNMVGLCIFIVVAYIWLTYFKIK